MSRLVGMTLGLTVLACACAPARANGVATSQPSACCPSVAGTAGAFWPNIFDTSDYPPRWYCGLWTAGHGWLHIISDVAIWAAYMAIPALLFYFIRRRRDVPFPRVFWLFCVFIFACGLTHLLEAAMFWWPAYRFMGLVKAGTAAVSILTVAALIPTLPKALEIPGVARLNEELKAEVRQRHRAEEWFRLAVESCPSGIVMVDAAGKIVLVNPHAEELFGYAHAQLIGQPLEILIPKRFREVHPRQRAQYLHAPQTRQMGAGRELFGLRSDGREVPIEIGLNPIVTDEGTFVLSAIVDISERKRLEDAYIRQQKDESLALLAGGIAHDFNNLLVPTLCHASMLRDGHATDSEMARSCETIIRAGAQMAELSKQLLAYANGGKYTPQRLCLNDVVTDVLHVASNGTNEGLRFEVRRQPDLWEVKADPAQMTQIILNLVINACEAMPEGGRPTVSTSNVQRSAWVCDVCGPRKAGEYVELSVSDTGCGMSPETLARAFEPFFSTKGAGRGLGLAAVSGILRSHGGAIEICTVHGGGTRATVWLPRHTAPLRAASLAPQPPATGTVLVVEDRPDVADAVTRVLERAGMNSLLAPDGHRALETYRAHQRGIDVVLLDLRLPKTPGEIVFRGLAEIDPYVRIVVWSGYDAASMPADLRYRPQYAGFLQKPVPRDTLVNALGRAIQSHHDACAALSPATRSMATAWPDHLPEGPAIPGHGGVRPPGHQQPAKRPAL